MGAMKIFARPLNPDDYAPYGQVVAPQDGARRPANQGTATRFLEVVDLVNARASARPHLSIYRCETPGRTKLVLRLLERHPHSTQVFLPCGAARYLSVVALGDPSPDLQTLRAFVVDGEVGISYRPGVWHHPMIPLDRVTSFWSWVFEDGTDADCEEVVLEPAIQLTF